MLAPKSTLAIRRKGKVNVLLRKRSKGGVAIGRQLGFSSARFRFRLRDLFIGRQNILAGCRRDFGLQSIPLYSIFVVFRGPRNQPARNHKFDIAMRAFFFRPQRNSRQRNQTFAIWAEDLIWCGSFFSHNHPPNLLMGDIAIYYVFRRICRAFCQNPSSSLPPT